MNEEGNFLTRPTNSGGNKLIIVFLSIIIILLIGIIAFLLLNGKDKNENTTNNTNNNNQQENNTSNGEENNTVDLITPEFTAVACGGVDFSFAKKTVSVNEISVKYKLGMLATVLLKSVDVSKIEAGVDTEIDVDIYETAKKYFEVNPDMLTEMEKGFSTSFYTFKYKNNKSYINIIIGGCTAPDNAGDYVKFKGSKKEGNILINSYYYYYSKNDPIEDETNVVFTKSLFKDKDAATAVYTKVKESDTVDYSVFDTYDLYFDTTNGNMKLTKIVYNAK